MSRASLARRQFRLGRPPKPGDVLPLHPHVVWRRALDALQSFRVMMLMAGLEREHVSAAIVFIEQANPETPRVLLVEQEGKTQEECEKAALGQLFRPDTIAIGMIFRQFDAQQKKQIIFPYQFTGLSEGAIALLRKAAEIQDRYTALTKDAN